MMDETILTAVEKAQKRYDASSLITQAVLDYMSESISSELSERWQDFKKPYNKRRWNTGKELLHLYKLTAKHTMSMATKVAFAAYALLLNVEIDELNE